MIRNNHYNKQRTKVYIYILNLLYLFPSDDFLDKIKSFAGSFQRTLRQK